MLTKEQLKNLATERLDEAQILYGAGKWDGAIYLCGYAVELGLKFVILCERLCGFPETKKEFGLYEQVKTHDLGELLKIVDRPDLQNGKAFMTSWQKVNEWRSEFRYRPIGDATEESAREMLQHTRDILKQLGI